MNQRTADPRFLRAFVTVAQEGNISRAAEKLHLSQPAVSLQLKQLAEFTGLELFDRTPHGVMLTHDGAALLPQAERTLVALAEFGLSARRMAGAVRGTLRIGTILDPEFTRLGAFLRELVRLAPEVEPELRQGMSGNVLASVQRGELDVGWFIGDSELDEARSVLHFEPLTRFNYCVVAPAGWGLQVSGRDWPELARLPWILTPPESVHHRLLAKTLAPLGLTQNRVAMVDQESSMLALVRSGLGLSLARDSIAIRESHSAGLVVADKVSIEATLGFICQRSARETALVRCAFDALRGAWI